MADAQYVINIATEMPDGDLTVAELDALTAELMGAGKGAEVFQEAVKTANAELARAKQAAAASGAALDEGKRKYAELEAAALAMQKAAEKAAAQGVVDPSLVANMQAADAAVAQATRRLRELERAAAAGVEGASQQLYEQSVALQALEREAARAARAVAKARKENAGIVPAEMQQKLDEANAAVNDYAKELARLEQEHAGNERAVKKWSGVIANVKKLSGHVDKSLSGTTDKLSKMSSAFGLVGGPIGRLGQRITGAAKTFLDLGGAVGVSRAALVVGVAAVAAATVAFVAMGAAVIASTIAIAKWGVAMSDAERSARLTRAAVDAVNPSMIAVNESARLAADEFGLAERDVAGFAKALKAAGVPAKDLGAAVRAAAMAERALGQGGGNEMIERIKSGEIAASNFANTIETKLGGIARKRMQGLDVQAARLRKNIGSLFSGLKLDPLLEGMQRLVGLFHEGSAVGRAIKVVFEQVFQPMIDSAAEATDAVEAFALGFAIQAMRLYLAFKPAIRAFKSFLGLGSDRSIEDRMDSAARAGEYLARTAAAIAAPFVLAAALIVGGFKLVWHIFDTVASVLDTVGRVAAGVFDGMTDGVALLIGKFVAFKDEVFDIFKAEGWIAAGKAIVQGMVQGITSGAKWLFDAVTSLSRGAIDAAKSALGIHSPSTEFRDVGHDTGEGYIVGVEDKQGETERAVKELVMPDVQASPYAESLSQSAAANDPTPAQRVAEPASSTTVTNDRSSRSVSKSAVIENNTFNFYGVRDAEHAAELTAEALTALLEGDADSLGDEDTEAAA